MLDWAKELNFEELVFWAFKDSYYNIMWRYSLREMKMYIRIKLSEKQTEAMSYFESVAKVLALAFGGNKKGKETKIQDENQLKMALNKMKG